jgi:hypothetical protein
MIHAIVLALLANPIGIHVRVDGSGYLRFAKATQLYLASDMNLVVRDGVLATQDGAVLIPRIHVPADALKLSVSIDGKVRVSNSKGTSEIGQLVLAILPNDETHSGLFRSTAKPTISNPGDGVAGVIRTSGSTSVSPGVSKISQDQTAQVLRITVNPSSEVDSQDFTVAQVATLSGPSELLQKAGQVSLGRTPILGATTRFEEPFLLERLLIAGLKPDQFVLVMPKVVEVGRPTQVVTQDQLTEAAIAAIREHYDVGTDLKADSKIPDLKVPKGDLVFSSYLSSKTDRSVTVVVSAVVNGIQAGSRSLTLVPPDDQTGVKTGDQVTIRVLSAGAVVEIRGKATTSGWVGQSISVTADTGSVLTAKVISGSVVEVRL